MDNDKGVEFMYFFFFFIGQKQIEPCDKLTN